MALELPSRNPGSSTRTSAESKEQPKLKAPVLPLRIGMNSRNYRR